MIGVIGSEDSVQLALQVARGMDLAHVLGRAYRSIDEVPALARELDPLCRFLLFTGRVPYATALAQDPPLRAALDFVPHSAIDLYRTLALVMRSNAGVVPAFVVDTIDRAIVEEVCQDLSLHHSPVSVLSLDVGDESEPGVGPLRDLDQVVEFHLEAARKGVAQLSLTCLGEVNRRLRELGLTVSRIEHTRSTLHHALTKASLAVRSSEAEDAQPVAALFRPTQKLGALAPQEMEGYARRLRGTVQKMAENTWCVHTTYGALQLSGLTAASGVPPDWEAGFGVGATLHDAEVNARRALKIGRPGGAVLTVLADGSVVGADAFDSPTLRLRETDAQLLAHARNIGLRAYTLTRLAVALRSLDPDSFTVRQLARAYGVEPRSAARLLARLESAGIASVHGVDAAPGAGRPQLVYKLEVERLLPSRS